VTGLIHWKRGLVAKKRTPRAGKGGGNESVLALEGKNEDFPERGGLNPRLDQGKNGNDKAPCPLKNRGDLSFPPVVFEGVNSQLISPQSNSGQAGGNQTPEYPCSKKGDGNPGNALTRRKLRCSGLIVPGVGTRKSGRKVHRLPESMVNLAVKKNGKSVNTRLGRSPKKGKKQKI